MDVIVGRFRHIEIHHVSERLDVDSTRGDVRRDQNFVLSILESGQCRGPLSLRTISVDPFRLDSTFHQLLGQAIRAMLGTREDQRLLHFAAIEQCQQ